MTDEKHPTGNETPGEAPEAQEAVEKDLAHWLREYGTSVGLAVALAVAVYLGTAFLRHRKATASADAAALLEHAETPEQLQALVDDYGKTPYGPVARLALGSRQYAAGEYAGARATYEAFLAAHPEHPMATAAELNRIQCIEAEGRAGEALQAYEAFLSAHPADYLFPVAWLGKGRCLEIQGRLDDARTVYEDFIAKQADSPWQAQAEASLEYVNQQLRAVREGDPPPETPEAGVTVAPPDAPDAP